MMPVLAGISFILYQLEGDLFIEEILHSLMTMSKAYSNATINVYCLNNISHTGLCFLRLAFCITNVLGAYYMQDTVL